MPDMRLAVTAAETAGPKAPLLLRGDLIDCLKQAASIGYQGIEIHVPNIFEFDADAFANSCRETGVGVSALVSGQLFVRMGLSISHDDPEIRQKAEEGLCRFVDAARTLGTGVVVGWVRGRIDARDPAEIMRRQGEAMARVDSYAAGAGVPLYIEAINRYELDSLNSAAEILAFIDEWKLAATYVHLDTFHMNIEEADSGEAVLACGPRLGYMHLAENTRWYPGAAHMDFRPVFGALEKIGYRGFVSVECLPFPDGRTAAEKAYANLTRLFPNLAKA